MNRTWLVTAFFFALLLLILYGAYLLASLSDRRCLRRLRALLDLYSQEYANADE